MALPNVNIKFGNGNISATTQTPDGVFGVLASAVAVGDTFLLNKPYVVKSMQDVANLGILPDVHNILLYNFLLDFYNEAGEGAEIWIMGVDKSQNIDTYFEPDTLTGKVLAQKLLDVAGGRITGVFVVKENASNPTLLNELNQTVIAAMGKAQTFADDYATKKFAPFFVVLPALNFSGDVENLIDLKQLNYNRVAIMIGDRESITQYNNGCALGLLAGRLAAYPVHVNAGKVKNGPLTPLQMFVLSEPLEQFDVETLHNKGFITLRTFPGKSGYYFTDDPLATHDLDDYKTITRRRVIDKVFRLAYQMLVMENLSELPINADGTINAIYAKDLEARIESFINANTTANGELPFDLQNPESPVNIQINLRENVALSSKLRLTIRVKPWGYARDIEAELSYQLQNNQ